MEINTTKEMTTGKLTEALVKYADSGNYPFHMPGHKRRTNAMPVPNFYSLDITEIEGFDNLHCAEGILKDAQDRAAALYGAEETFFLINGSTCGILSAISAAAPAGAKLLMARNSHRSAYHAVFLRGIHPVYLHPGILEEFGVNGGIDPEEVEQALKKDPEIAAVYITSPTMDGMVTDIKTIASICHVYGKVLIVDEAHGAHFGFADFLPRSSVQNGADIVIHSVHKTLPAPTQTALLHVNGPRADRKRLRQFLAVYQSSSPSYLLMSGIDRCIAMLEDASSLFQGMQDQLQSFRKKTDLLLAISILGKDVVGKANIHDTDCGKLIISVKNTLITGRELYDMLVQRFHLQMEMPAQEYVLGIVTFMDTVEGMERLADALLQLDGELSGSDIPVTFPMYEEWKEKPDIVYTPAEADNLKKKTVFIQESAGLVSGEYVYLYPPGVPVLVPGERISENIRDQILNWRKLELPVQGPEEIGQNRISIIIEKRS